MPFEGEGGFTKVQEAETRFFLKKKKKALKHNRQVDLEKTYLVVCMTPHITGPFLDLRWISQQSRSLWVLQ